MSATAAISANTEVFLLLFIQDPFLSSFRNVNFRSAVESLTIRSGILPADLLTFCSVAVA
jgi:hypothetical protein